MPLISLYLLTFDPDSDGVTTDFVALLLAVCSISPRLVLQDSAAPAASVQADSREDQISPQNQEPAGRAPKKQLSFVLENEKQQ